MSFVSGRNRLRVLVVASAAVVGLGLGVPAAMADPTPSNSASSHSANAEFFDIQCAVPPNHDPAVTRQLYAIGESRGINDKVMLAMFETGWVESHMQNLNCGDRDSLGVFQQRPSQGWCDPASLCLDVAHATNKFLDRAIPNDRNNPHYTPGQLAQSVQISAFPDRYDAAEAKAREMIAEAGGGTLPPSTPVYETASGNGWQPMLVGFDGQPLYAGTMSAVVRADGTKIIYSVRDGRLYEAASNTGWRNLQVPNHDQVSAVSAVAHGDGIVVYTVRGGAVYEAGSGTWQPMLVGHNGQPLYASTISAVVRADGTKIIYSVRDGRLHEAASNTGWRNLQVPNHDQVSAVSAVAHGDGIVVYTVRGGAVYEAGNHNWQPMLVGHNGQPLYASTISAVVRADGTKIIYTVRDGRVYEAASNTGWVNLQVPNLNGVTTVAAIQTGGTVLYTR
ncbi:hypothetical protein [Stackebrandtia soli]|uniref:hypothetical protein n=1 Tax=Stackebrandtia soli TaxID=1892856 RepID=UPI0039E7C230